MRMIGKNRGLARLADADGHFRMVALDQRPPLFDAIARAQGITRNQVEYSDITAAKRLLVENLAPHCSSMLFDPNFAVPAGRIAFTSASGAVAPNWGRITSTVTTSRQIQLALKYLF